MLMSPDKEALLCERYPMLFAMCSRGPRESAMAFGFECGDGWFDIIDAASAKLEAINRGLGKEKIVAEQVKEKFGGLRYYLSAPPSVCDQAYAIAAEAEHASEKTCEACGKPGVLRNIKFWLTTLCDKCHEERQRERREPANITIKVQPK